MATQVAGLDYEVLVVGAGVTGAGLALALVKAGMRVALLEARPAQPLRPPPPGLAGYDLRVTALNVASRQFLEHLGVWDSVTGQRVAAFDHMKVWDGEGLAGIHFHASEAGQEHLGYIVENRVLSSSLHRRLEAFAKLDWFQGARCHSLVRCLDSAGQAYCLVSLEDGRQLSAALVVGADGANSMVRHLAGFGTRQRDYGQQAIVANVRVAETHGNTAWQRFMSTGPLALLPLPPLPEADSSLCAVVWSADRWRADQLLEMDDRRFSSELGRCSEYCLGEVLETSPRRAFALQRQHVLRYAQPGVALIGDAAHVIHPLAGQGVNLGLQDAAVLATEVLAAGAAGRPPGELRILRRYQRRRQSHNLLMMATTDLLKRWFGSSMPLLCWLRNRGMDAFDLSPRVKRQLIQVAIGGDSRPDSAQGL